MNLTLNLSSEVHGPPDVRESILRTRLDAARHMIIALAVMALAQLVLLVVLDLSK